jgi:carbon-monoxide dehydrogenase medium subunit
MYPKSFEYVRAESVEHALSLLAEHGEEARLLAGGASLIPLMKLRLASPAVLVDIGRLPLSEVRREDGDAGTRGRGDAERRSFAIGALARHADLERNAELRAALPIVHDAASQIGDTQVRNMGTIGGSLAECDPAGDWAPVLLALGGSVRVRGPSGERQIGADDLFVEAYTTALRPEEMIVEVMLASGPLPSPSPKLGGGVPGRGPPWGAAHAKIELRAGDYAIANCSVAVGLDEAGRFEGVRIALGGVGLAPLRVTKAEAMMEGEVVGEGVLGEAAEEVSRCTESYSDVRASKEYRRHLGGVVFRRALETAIERGGNGGTNPHVTLSRRRRI